MCERKAKKQRTAVTSEKEKEDSERDCSQEIAFWQEKLNRLAEQDKDKDIEDKSTSWFGDLVESRFPFSHHDCCAWYLERMRRLIQHKFAKPTGKGEGGED